MGQSLAKVSLVATMATLMQHFHFCLADEVISWPTFPRSDVLSIRTLETGCPREDS